MRRILFLTGLSFFLLSEAASEEETLYSFPPIRIVGERSILPSVTILTSEEIEGSGAEDLGEILRRVEGVFVKEYGGSSGLKTLSILGFSPEEVLILLDGKPLNSPQTGQVDLSILPLHFVERIEIFRGGGSSKFGGSAMGGVINIVTKSGVNKPVTSLHSTMGSFNTRLLTLSRLQKSHRWSYALSFQGEESENDYPYFSGGAKKLRMNADRSAFDLFTKIGFELNPSSHLSLSSHYFNSDQGDPGSLILPTPRARRETKRNLYDIQYRTKIKENWGLKVLLYHQRFQERYENPDPPFLSRDVHENDGTGVKIEQDYLMRGGHRFNWDLNAIFETLESTKVGERKRESGSLSLQGEIRPPLLPRVALLPTLRMDLYSFGINQSASLEKVISPRFDLLLSIKGVSFYGGLGRSFRPPTFNELYWPKEPFAEGNPDLAPEKSIHFDGGGSYRLVERAVIRVNLFMHRISNQILWQPDPSGRWSPHNIGLVENQGVETRADYRFQVAGFRFQTSFNYSYLSSKDRSGDPITEGKQIIYRPHDMANLSASVEAYSFRINLQERFVGERPVLPSNKKWLPHYFLTDLHFSYKPSLGGVRGIFKIGIRNLLDKKYEIIRSYPQPGREWRFSLGVEF